MDHLGIVTRLRDAGHSAWIVGGAVRDFLLGKAPKDWDVATSAGPDEIRRAFSDRDVADIGGQAGKGFSVFSVDGTEVATFRADVDGRTAVQVGTIEEDLARRDLTINSMAMWPVGGTIVDPFGGQRDIKNRVIRFTGDARRRIAEDPLRMLRACRFLATTGSSRFSVDTFDAICNSSHLLGVEVPKERIGIETMKAMESPTPGNFFRALRNTWLIDDVFPGVSECVGHEGGRHHRETVFEHMVMTCDNVAKLTSDPRTRLAGFLHDIGKPAAWRLMSNGSFKGHDEIGAEMAAKALCRLRMPNSVIGHVETLVREHMANVTLEMATTRMIRRLILRLAGVGLEELIILTVADHDANLAKVPHDDSVFPRLMSLFERVKKDREALQIKDLAVGGHDVMDALGVKGGPVVGRVLKWLFDEVTDNNVKNDRQTLLRMIASFTDDTKTESPNGKQE